MGRFSPKKISSEFNVRARARARNRNRNRINHFHPLL